MMGLSLHMTAWRWDFNIQKLISMGILNAAQAGFLGSVFSIIYVAEYLINGAVSDTTLPWKMITAEPAVVGISNLFVGFCDIPWRRICYDFY